MCNFGKTFYAAWIITVVADIVALITVCVHEDVTCEQLRSYKRSELSEQQEQEFQLCENHTDAYTCKFL